MADGAGYTITCWKMVTAPDGLRDQVLCGELPKIEDVFKHQKEVVDVDHVLYVDFKDEIKPSCHLVLADPTDSSIPELEFDLCTLRDELIVKALELHATRGKERSGLG